MADMENPGAHGRCATGAGKPGHATAAGTRTIAQDTGRAKRAGRYRIQPEGAEPFEIYAKGREAWALDRLRAVVRKDGAPC